MAPSNPYTGKNRDWLDNELARRGLEPPETGSGSEGRVVNADLERLLITDDEQVKPGTPAETGRPDLADVAQTRADRRERTARVIGAAQNTTREEGEAA